MLFGTWVYPHGGMRDCCFVNDENVLTVSWRLSVEWQAKLLLKLCRASSGTCRIHLLGHRIIVLAQALEILGSMLRGNVAAQCLRSLGAKSWHYQCKTKFRINFCAQSFSQRCWHKMLGPDSDRKSQSTQEITGGNWNVLKRFRNKLLETSCQVRKAHICSLAFALRKFRNLGSKSGVSITNLNFKQSIIKKRFAVKRSNFKTKFRIKPFAQSLSPPLVLKFGEQF